MKRFSEQFQKKAQSIRLSTTETHALRERVISYMEYHPRKTADGATYASVRGGLAEPVRLVSGWNVLRWVGAPAIGLFLMVTYLAEQAVPGDSLYAVKVSFNEEVRSTLAFSPYEKVVWETERLNRRIAEARVLASEGRLTEAAEAEVVKAVKVHSDNARREIAVIKETDEEEAALASLQLATSIEVQTTSLRSSETSSTTEGNSTALLATALALSGQADEADEETVLPSYARLSAHIEQETTRAYELLRSVEKVATSEEHTDITRRMEDIDRSVREAITLATDPAQELVARETLLAAISRTQRLIVFMTNIDVRKSLTVEQIVPVTPTKEERLAKVSKIAAKNMQKIVLVETALQASSTETSVIEKLSSVIVDTRANIEDTLTTLQAKEFDLGAVELRIETDSAVLVDAAAILQISLDIPDTNTTIDPAPEVPLETETSTTTGTTTDPLEVLEDVIIDASSTPAVLEV